MIRFKFIQSRKYTLHAREGRYYKTIDVESEKIAGRLQGDSRTGFYLLTIVKQGNLFRTSMIILHELCHYLVYLMPFISQENMEKLHDLIEEYI